VRYATITFYINYIKKYLICWSLHSDLFLSKEILLLHWSHLFRFYFCRTDFDYSIGNTYFKFIFVEKIFTIPSVTPISILFFVERNLITSSVTPFSILFFLSKEIWLLHRSHLFRFYFLSKRFLFLWNHLSIQNIVFLSFKTFIHFHWNHLCW